MIRLRGHFDGQSIVLDDPAPSGLRADARVEIVVLEAREQALRDMEAFLKALWERPIPPASQLPPRRWAREELYERGGKGVS
jgi:hypothetical protein